MNPDHLTAEACVRAQFTDDFCALVDELAAWVADLRDRANPTPGWRFAAEHRPLIDILEDVTTAAMTAGLVSMRAGERNARPAATDDAG